MASTYSTNLALELIGTGDQAGSWGNTTNTNLGTLIEQSISGYVTQAVSTGTDTTITIPNGATGVARNMYIELTGTGGSNTNLIVPANKKLYFIFNNSTGAVTVKVTGQTGVSVPTGKKMVLVSNGTDIVNGLNYIADFASNSATITHLSATSATITNLTLTSLVISNLSIASANVTTLTSASATITNLLATTLTISGVGVFPAGTAAAPALTTTGDTNTGIFFPAADTIAFTEGGVEAARFDSSGNLGLGVTPTANQFAGYKTFQIASQGLISSDSTSNGELEINNNAYRAVTTATLTYINSFAATKYAQYQGEHRWFTAASGTAGNAISFTQAMTLDASGRLGVGTTSPDSMVEVNSSTAAYARLKVNYNGSALTYLGSFSGIVGSGNATDTMLASTGVLAFGAGGTTERARITSGGYSKFSNDGTYYGSTGSYHEFISTSSGENILRLDNEGSPSPYGIEINFSGASPDNNTQWFLRCVDSTTTRCYIWSDGDLANHDGVYGQISDQKLKQDIVDAPSQWDDLKAVRFRKYRMKTDVEADPNAPALLGVVAQELEQVCPGLVDEHPDMEMVEVTDEEGNVTQTQQPTGTTTKTVKSSILLMKAAVALQEAMARIEQLEAKVAALETK